MPRIIVTNDIHSHIYESSALFDYLLREKKKGAFIVDLGDFMQGSYFHQLHGGVPERQLLSGIYDVVVPGNHGFSETVRWGRKRGVVICCNITTAAGRHAFNPCIHITDGAVTACVIGVMASEAYQTIPVHELRGLRFADPFRAVATQVKKYRKKVDRIVVCSHSGLKFDMELATRCPGIDVIVSSHCHTGSTMLQVNDTVIVQADDYGRSCVELRIGRDAVRSKIIRTNARANGRFLHPQLQPLNHYLRSYSHQQKATAAVLPQKLYAGIRRRPDFLAHIARLAAAEWQLDGVLLNEFYMRDDLPARTLTNGSFYKLFPFANELVQFSMPRKACAQLLHQLRQTASLNMIAHYKPLSDRDHVNIATTDFMYTNFIRKGSRKLISHGELRTFIKKIAGI